MAWYEKLISGALAISASVILWTGAEKILKPLAPEADTQAVISSVDEKLKAYNEMIDNLGDVVDAVEKLKEENNVDTQSQSVISGDPPKEYDGIGSDDISEEKLYSENGDGTIEIHVESGEIRKGHLNEGTRVEQQKFDLPIDRYIAQGAMFEVDSKGERVYPDTGKDTIPQGPMAGDWQSRTAEFDQKKVNEYINPNSSDYNPANYERVMAQARCDAYQEVKGAGGGSTAWDSMSPEDRNEVRESNPARAEILERDYFGRIEDKNGDLYQTLEDGYTTEELGMDDDRDYSDYDMLDSNTGRDIDQDVEDFSTDDLPNRTLTPDEALKELKSDKENISENPHLDYKAEEKALQDLDEKELKTGIIEPNKLYAGNDGFLGERHDDTLLSGDIVSRYAENGHTGSDGSFATRAEFGPDGNLQSPDYEDRSMVGFEERMQEHFYQVAPGPTVEETDSIENKDEDNEIDNDNADPILTDNPDKHTDDNKPLDNLVDDPNSIESKDENNEFNNDNPDPVQAENPDDHTDNDKLLDNLGEDPDSIENKDGDNAINDDSADLIQAENLGEDTEDTKSLDPDDLNEFSPNLDNLGEDENDSILGNLETELHEQLDMQQERKEERETFQANYNQDEVEEKRETDPDQYERLMAANRMATREEIDEAAGGETCWDTMSTKEKFEMLNTNPDRANALLQDYQDRHPDGKDRDDPSFDEKKMYENMKQSKEERDRNDGIPQDMLDSPNPYREFTPPEPTESNHL